MKQAIVANAKLFLKIKSTENIDYCRNRRNRLFVYITFFLLRTARHVPRFSKPQNN